MGSTHGIKFKDKIGYALGDTAGTLTFGLITPFQLMFYTDVLHIDGSKAAIMLLIARIWDAINDPMWGAFVDSRKPTKRGRFRPYILGASIPLAVTAILMFMKIPGLTSLQYLIYAGITYVLYSMMYTGTSIPYGSLASVVTDDEIERSSLSMWRSIGAGLGGLPAQIILPLVVYSFNEKTGKKDILNSDKLLYCVIALAVISVCVYFIHYKLTTERVTSSGGKSDFSIFRTLKDLVKNKEFIVISLTSMLLVVYQQFTQTAYNYLFKDYYGKPGLFALVTVCTYAPMAVLIPLMGKLIRRFGKKEICCAGIALTAVMHFIMYLAGFTGLIQNAYVFLILVFFSSAGMAALTLEIWALAMDVIDYHELKTGRKEEGTCYSVFTFMRKIGQTIAGSGTALLLSLIKYNTEAIGNQSSDVLDSLYNISTIIPAVVMGLNFVLLAFLYKFGKKELAAMHEKLELQRANEK